VPSSEQGALLTEKGDINQTGIGRIRNALFARAYGSDSDSLNVLQKLAESTDSNVRNITTALVNKAGSFIQLRDAIDRGIRHPLDVSNDIARAVGKLSELRDSGTPVEKYLAQGQLGDRELSPESERLLQVFDQNKRSSKAIGEILDNYIRAVDAAGNPGQADMFGDTITPAKADFIEAAIKEFEDAKKAQPGLYPQAPEGVEPGPAGSPAGSAINPNVEGAGPGGAGSTVPRLDSPPEGQHGPDDAPEAEGPPLNLGPGAANVGDVPTEDALNQLAAAIRGNAAASASLDGRISVASRGGPATGHWKEQDCRRCDSGSSDHRRHVALVLGSSQVHRVSSNARRVAGCKSARGPGPDALR
jgi:hypothetical protein